MPKTTHRTALMEMIHLLETGEPIFPETKKRLIELEKLQMIHAYDLDPDLMKVRYRSGSQWFKETYGL